MSMEHPFLSNRGVDGLHHTAPVNTTHTSHPGLIPLWLKMAYGLFVAVLIPVYWVNYGPTNFLYFCDIALLITLYGMCTERPLPVSMAAVGILVPQALWCVDFAWQFVAPHSGMTAYMFDAHKSLFLRGLSLSHGWLPFLLVFLVMRLGYDRRALKHWTVLAWALCLVAYFFLPPAGAQLADPNTPLNVDYVFGMDDTKPQTWMPPGVYLGVWMLVLLVLAYVPAHLILNRLFGNRTSR